MVQELTIEGETFSIGNILAMGGFLGGREPMTVYVIGDDQRYGTITTGSVTVSNVYQPLGNRKKFIEDHRDARFYPVSQGALDDLNTFEFMYNERTALFEVPRKS